jgi:heme exporter protein B
MTIVSRRTTTFWWLVHKDLSRAIRRQSGLPAMLLVGLVLACLLALQIDLVDDQKIPLVSALVWLAIAFAGTLGLEWSFAAEREDGCWLTLRLYPVAPSMLYFSKVIVNIVSMTILELVLVPLFLVMTDVPLLLKPAALALIAILGNIGFAAAGTLLSAITANLRNRGGLLALLFLPLVIPVILACAQTTTAMVLGEIDAQWWRWIQFLAVCAIVFTGLGALVFEVVVEE